MPNFQFSPTKSRVLDKVGTIFSDEVESPRQGRDNFQSKPKFSIFKRLEIGSLNIHWKLVPDWIGDGNWKFQQGFTLLEMVVSLGIFSVLVVTATGIVLSVSSAQLRAAEIQAVQDNIRFSLELITKEMRTGSAYTLTEYGDACGGASNPADKPSEITFTTSKPTTPNKRTYYLDFTKKAIMRITNDGTNCIADAVQFTAESVEAERLIFHVSGAAVGPSDGQPRITITLKVKAKDPKLQQGSSMDLETTVAQRLRDL